MMRGDYISSIKRVTCGAFLRPAVSRCLYYTKQADERPQGQLILIWFSPIHMVMPHVPVLGGDQLPDEKQLVEMFQVLWRSQSEGRVCPGCALHSFSWDWAAVASSWGLGPDCTWSQSHVATSVSNAFCCCAWLGDGVVAANYATSVIHTCILAVVLLEACSFQKVSQNLGEAKWYRWV